MKPPQKGLLTGGTGRLGRELVACMSDVLAPPRAELDVTRSEQVGEVLDAVRPDVIVHAAAFTNVAKCETEREACWRVNVEGTANVARAATARGIFLVHISTDYVFDGTRGGYREDDAVGPVRNYYSLTKLVAEAVARTTPRHLVLRTSFRPREWPYETAFVDVRTSQDYVDIIAPMIALAVRHCRDIPFDTLHVATEPKTIHELARRRRPDVRPASRHDVDVVLPADCTLDVSRWAELEARLSQLD